MGSFTTVTGDLIDLAKSNHFGIIAHGCNCMNNQGKGIAKRMAQEFGTDNFPLEQDRYYGDYNKMGCIDAKAIVDYGDIFVVVNCYTQYRPGQPGLYGIPLDYDALALCMRKIAYEYAQGYIGLPMIGCGLAGGNWNNVEKILRRELKDCYVTIVKLPQ